MKSRSDAEETLRIWSRFRLFHNYRIISKIGAVEKKCIRLRTQRLDRGKARLKEAGAPERVLGKYSRKRGHWK